MKTERQEAMLRLISDRAIDTQEELMESLRRQGFPVTQATVSRDIRELGIHKVRDESGNYRYVMAHSGEAESDLSSKFSVIFSEAVRSVDFAQNIVVVKCHTGMANAVCATFDAAKMHGVVGTLSGDDTFFAVTATSDDAAAVCEQLRTLLRP